MTTENKTTEIKQLEAELISIKENTTSKQAVAACDDALKLAADILSNKKTDRYFLKITTHGGKMSGIRSLNTYKLVCDTCTKLKHIKNSICFKCYADKQLTIYKQLAPALIYNTLLLKYTKLTTRQIPVLNDVYFRFESFSDLQNAQHLENIYKIARMNPRTNFALWTKNISLILKYKAPRNVNLILSSVFLNACILSDASIDSIKRKTGARVVKLFTVYDDKHATAAGINCAKKCLNCLKCYKKSDKTIFINELLKK